MPVQAATLLVQKCDPATCSIVDETIVNDHAKNISGFRIARPLVVNLLTDGSEFNWLTSRSIVQDVVSTHGHGYLLTLELGRNFGYFQFLTDRLICFHVEALNGVGSVDFR